MTTIQIQHMTPEDMAAMFRKITREEIATALKNHQKAEPVKDRITPKQAAKIAGKSVGTIYNRADDGILTKFPTVGNRYDLSREEVERVFCRVSDKNNQ